MVVCLSQAVLVNDSYWASYSAFVHAHTHIHKQTLIIMHTHTLELTHTIGWTHTLPLSAYSFSAVLKVVCYDCLYGVECINSSLILQMMVITKEGNK